jgi:FAD/FMN-containing dehydrogenase
VPTVTGWCVISGDRAVAVVRLIKDALDPRGLLNPGRMLA